MQIVAYDGFRDVGVTGGVEGVTQVMKICELKGNGDMGDMHCVFRWLGTGCMFGGNGFVPVYMLREEGRYGRMLWGSLRELVIGWMRGVR